jgi:hypothetical protein
MRPVIASSPDVQRILDESRRVRLITQIVSSPEDFPNEFASNFLGATKGTVPAHILTSHSKPNAIDCKVTVPTYPLVQSLRWNPYIAMSSPNNSITDITEDKQYNCRCETCAVKKCPSKINSQYSKPCGFKDNIMTFSDRYTMTPRLNDVCCGVCTPVRCTPTTSEACIAVRDTETETHLPITCPQQNCSPIPILKMPERSQPPCPYNYCGHAPGHAPMGIRQEAVRDIDMGEDYCEVVKPKSLKVFLKSKKKCKESSNCVVSDRGRRIIYNEGISDDVANSYHAPVIRPSYVNVNKDCSRSSLKSPCSVDRDDLIPFSHRSQSRYHHSCKKPNLRSFHCTSEADDVRCLMDTPRVVRKNKFPVKHCKAPNICLPRKVLTSELDIDAYMERNKPAIVVEPSSFRKKCKRFF